MKWDITSLLSDCGRTLIKVELKEPINPIDVIELNKNVEERIKKLRNMDLVVLSGRLPIWAYASLTHKLSHLVKIVCIYDPKLNNKAVIVSSHSKAAREGEIIELSKEEIEHLL